MVPPAEGRAIGSMATPFAWRSRWRAGCRRRLGSGSHASSTAPTADLTCSPTAASACASAMARTWITSSASGGQSRIRRKRTSSARRKSIFDTDNGRRFDDDTSDEDMAVERPGGTMGVKPGGVVAAIDVGTTKVCTLIGDLDEAGKPRVRGVGITASHGMKRGTIDNMADVTAAVRRSLEQAEDSAGGIAIQSAVVGLAGAHVSCLNNKGLTVIANPNRPIGPADVERALDSARTIAVPSNREVVHVLPRQYAVDGSEQGSNPVGMHGHRLDVEAHVVTAAVSAMQNLKRCITTAEINVEQLVLGQLASADAVLDAEERRYGVILADIGGGTTDIVVMLNDAVYHTAVLPVGGDSITNDLVVGIR